MEEWMSKAFFIVLLIKNGWESDIRVKPDRSAE